MDESQKKMDELKQEIIRSRQAIGSGRSAETDSLLESFACEMLSAGFTERRVTSELAGLGVPLARSLVLLRTASAKVREQLSAGPPSRDTFAIMSLIVGIVSLPEVYFNWIVGGPLGLLAAILGLISLRRIKRSQGGRIGRGLAIAGIVIGDISVILAIVGFSWITGHILRGR